MLTMFRTLVSRIRPVEVVCDSAMKKSDMTKILINSPIKPAFSYIRSDEFLDHKGSVILLEYFMDDCGFPEVIKQALEEIDG
jgi:hypothetical protein